MELLEFLFTVWLFIFIGQFIVKILMHNPKKKRGLDGHNWR